MAQCQHHKIEPFAYLHHALDRVAQHAVTQLDARYRVSAPEPLPALTELQLRRQDGFARRVQS